MKPSARFSLRDDRETLAQELADWVSSCLSESLSERGEAKIAFSGGTTPSLFMERLSCSPLDWKSVTVTLVDERFVPHDHPRSNFALLREHLLRNEAACAKAIPLWSDQGIEDAAREANQAIERLRPLDVAILGMGTDGHTASFFPAADRLAQALDPDSPRSVEIIRAPGAPEPRLTLTLPVLLEAKHLALHIEGDEKLKTLESAFDGADLPVAKILDSARIFATKGALPL